MMYSAGCPSNSVPTASTPTPHKMTHSTSRDNWVFCHGSSCSAFATSGLLRARWMTAQKISARSMIDAPMIMPSAIRNEILRKGSPGFSQPMLMK